MAGERKSKWEGDTEAGDLTTQPGTRITGAIVLIALGVLLLLSQNGLLSLQGNWWAILIALPALAMLYTGYTAYRREGRMTAEAGSSLSGGVIVGLIAVLAATSRMDLTLPLLLIVIGIFVGLGWHQPRRHRRNRA